MSKRILTRSDLRDRLAKEPPSWLERHLYLNALPLEAGVWDSVIFDFQGVLVICNFSWIHSDGRIDREFDFALPMLTVLGLEVAGYEDAD
jgi:hypothetical protein